VLQLLQPPSLVDLQSTKLLPLASERLLGHPPLRCTPAPLSLSSATVLQPTAEGLPRIRRIPLRARSSCLSPSLCTFNWHKMNPAHHRIPCLGTRHPFFRHTISRPPKMHSSDVNPKQADLRRLPSTKTRARYVGLATLFGSEDERTISRIFLQFLSFVDPLARNLSCPLRLIDSRH
jgi:hypothetical protein